MDITTLTFDTPDEITARDEVIAHLRTLEDASGNVFLDVRPAESFPQIPPTNEECPVAYVGVYSVRNRLDSQPVYFKDRFFQIRIYLYNYIDAENVDAQKLVLSMANRIAMSLQTPDDTGVPSYGFTPSSFRFYTPQGALQFVDIQPSDYRDVEKNAPLRPPNFGTLISFMGEACQC